MFKTMWPLGKGSSSAVSSNNWTKESISDELHGEVRTAAPGARLSYVLRTTIERLTREERREIVAITQRPDNCAPLFIACKKGNLEIVEYLIETCGADVEQKGTYEVVDDKTSHRVTPLWCAAVSGRLNIVKCLVKNGANINSVSDTGSTPVRSACFMTHMEIVQFLVEQANANIHIPNYNGGTCLINSVQSASLCEYLLSKNADVNAQDVQLKTALHYAIQEHRFETTKLLLANNADPFLKNRYGDDALQTSCLKGAHLIFNYLLDTIPSYSRERRAEMHELMGSTFLDEHHDIQMALHFWKKALEIRFDPDGILPDIPKKSCSSGSSLYATIITLDGEKVEINEFQNREELEGISTDLDQIRINSLLIAERILGPAHKDVIFRMMYRGAFYADSAQYRLCIRLWRYALQLRIQKDSLLYGDTCFTALALIRLFLDLERSTTYSTQQQELMVAVHSGNSNIAEDLLGTYELLIDQIPSCSQLVKIRPVFKRQQESFDRVLRCCTHLLYLILKLPSKTVVQCNQLRDLTTKLVKLDVRMCLTGDTLLHLAVSRLNIVRSHFFVDDHQVCVFPSLPVAKYLIECGSSANDTNNNRATPLHLVVSADNFDIQIVDLLLAAGAHIDQLDISNQSPLKILGERAHTYGFSLGEHMSLKCIAARAVCATDIDYDPRELPRELVNFVSLHRAHRDNTDSTTVSTSIKKLTKFAAAVVARNN